MSEVEILSLDVASLPGSASRGQQNPTAGQF